MSHQEQLPPNYGRLDIALRSIGYSFEAAVADIIDNSIDASASSVVVKLILRKGHPLDAVIWDDGEGMSSTALKEAMRFGADVDTELDRLGKFGLGLKLASLSQAKALKVISLQNGQLSGRAWLEDGIAKGFACEVYTPAECKALVASAAADRHWSNTGTLVWWSGLYRVGHHHANPAEHAQKLLHRLKDHLSLSFHRFLGGKPKKVAIALQTYDADLKTSGIPMQLAPLDPFGYPKSGCAGLPVKLVLDPSQQERLSITAHVWPPNSDSPNYKLPGGANSRQGFYFYRNNRLIQGGGWNGLREAEPHSSLARLAIDMAPDCDVDMSLDVKKVMIQLPPQLAKAIQHASSADGLTFKQYLAKADKAYRTRAVTDAELPLIPSEGFPAPFRKFLHSELRLKATAKHRDLHIKWSDLDADMFFAFDRDSDHLYLNRKYRSRLQHGLHASSADIPVVKSMLFLLLRDALESQRTGKKLREELEQLNRILVEAVKYERDE